MKRDEDYELIKSLFTVGVIAAAVLKIGIMFAQWLRPFAEQAIRAGLI